ncbi:MAG: hypothetical protein ACYDAK_05090 [Candidatus Limnocylindrales bacterium]
MRGGPAGAIANLPEPRASGAWRGYLRLQYRLIALLDPLVRTWWRGYGLGNVVELRVLGRRTGRERNVLLGLLRDGDRWFLGHPNGDVPWTRNLEAAGGATLTLSWPASIRVRARRLEAGELRDRAIAATGQHVFPGNVVYRLARAHIRAVGVYFIIDAEASEAAEAAGA